LADREGESCTGTGGGLHPGVWVLGLVPRVGPQVAEAIMEGAEEPGV
jgi:hypothetical protein